MQSEVQVQVSGKHHVILFFSHDGLQHALWKIKSVAMTLSEKLFNDESSALLAFLRGFTYLVANAIPHSTAIHSIPTVDPKELNKSK